MAARAPHIPTFDELYDEIRRLPQGVTGEILEPGVLHTMSRPGRPHRRAAKLCLDELGRFDEDRRGKGWWIESEPEIRFGLRLCVPDLAGWRIERVPRLPTENPISLVPDWCCEILSPNTARIDRMIKLPLYARSGVSWIWLIDPELRLVEVYESVQGRATLTTSASDDEAPVLMPFEGEFPLASFWMPPETPEPSGDAP